MTTTRLRVEATFDAATALPGHDRCQGLHGHTYRVEVVVAGQPQGGVLSDFREIRAVLRRLLEAYDHKDLRRLFDYPSCEAICQALCRDLAAALPGFERVRVWEGEGKWVEMEARELAAARP